MTRALLIGNSHVGPYLNALKHAEGELALDLDCIAAFGDGLERYTIEDGVFCGNILDPKVTGRKGKGPFPGSDARAVLKDYDVVLLTGLRFSIFQVIRVFRDLGLVTMDSSRDYATAAENGVTLVSEALLHRLIAERLSGSLMMQIARDIRAATNAPILVLAQPRPTRQVLVEGTRFETFCNAEERGEGDFVSKTYERLAQELCAGIAAHYVPQPPGTIDGGMFTDTSYMMGTLRPPFWKKNGRPVDFRHGNARYGARMLKHVARELETL